MIFNGIAVFAVLSNIGSAIRDNLLGAILLLLVFFGALFYLGYRLYTGGGSKKKATSSVQLSQGTPQAPPPDDPLAQRSKPDSHETVPIHSLCTVIVSYLELPFHDGDCFFLFQSAEDANRFISLSGRNDLFVRTLLADYIKRELMEYLCCGYTGAVLKKDLSSIKICGADERIPSEELIRIYALPMSSVGSVLPTAGKKMHNYLNQMSYTYRKYGTDPSAVPAFWQEHLNNFKAEPIRHLLCATLCLPAGQGNGKSLTFSIPTVSMPSGQKWAALFTDSFALSRYYRKPVNSIAFPNLLSDVARDLRSGRITDVAGLMINPGREEFKMTLDEITAQEAWLIENPKHRDAYAEKVHFTSPAAPEKMSTEARSLKEEAENRPQSTSTKAGTESSPQPSPAKSKTESNSQSIPMKSETESNLQPGSAESAMGSNMETFQKIDLSGDLKKASVTPGRSFFMGLLPGEKPYSEADSVDAEENRPNTEGYTRLSQIGFESRWSEYWYDPAYRRIVYDTYSTDGKVRGRRYHGRRTILPLDLIDQFNQHPEDRNPDKVTRIKHIQDIMRNEHFDHTMPHRPA